MKAALDRYLQEHGYPHTLSDKVFFKSREAFKAYLKASKKAGLGRKAHAAEPLTEEDQNRLIEAGMLGKDTPWSLQFTVFYHFTKGFGMRGRDEHRQLR